MTTALATRPTSDTLVKPANVAEEILAFRQDKIIKSKKVRIEEERTLAEKKLLEQIDWFVNNFLRVSSDFFFVSENDLRTTFREDRYVSELETLIASKARINYWKFNIFFLSVPILGWITLFHHRSALNSGGSSQPLFYGTFIATCWRYYRRRKLLIESGLNPKEELMKNLRAKFAVTETDTANKE